VSSAGLRVLLKAAKIARTSQHRLALAGRTPQVQEVFDISGFTAIFTIYESRQRAIESLR
jgi:anti-sigma B factor antagonist